MKKIKNLALSAILSIAVISVSMISCTPDACKDVVCNNGGVCTDGSCECVSGYEGTDCSTLSATKFLGTNNASATYAFNDASNASCGTYTGNMSIALSSTDDTKLIITNLGGFGSSTTVTATVDGTTLTIATQQIQGASANTISGTGTYSNGVITGSYTNNDGSSTCTYNFTWTKQ